MKSKKYIECKCGTPEHLARISWDNFEDEAPEIYMEFHLNPYKNIWQRLYGAIKYVLGYRSKYGDWDCILLSDEEVDGIIGTLEQYMADKRAWELKNQNSTHS